MIDALEEQIRRHGDHLELAVSAEDVRRISRSDKIAVLMGLEGGHSIEDDLVNLRRFRDRGVRYMTLTWNNTNGWADSSGDDARHGGLTEFGREVIGEMNRLGMVVDVSHASDDTFWDALKATRAPLMASHSSARALVDNPRNLSDEMLEAVAQNGGVVMVNFGGTFIDPRKASKWRIIRDLILHWGPSPVSLDLLLDHIDHVIRVAGIDHVGLGSDFDGTLLLPEGASDVSGFPNVTAGLLERGYSQTEIRKILGENALRVLEQAEAVEAPSEGE
jgi:membrane dipeptidase